MTQYWGGAQDTFSYQLFKILKNWEGGAYAPHSPPAPWPLTGTAEQLWDLGEGGGRAH